MRESHCFNSILSSYHPSNLNTSHDLYRLPSKNKIPNPDYDGNDGQKEESTRKGVAPNFDDMKQMVIKHHDEQQLRYLIILLR